MRSYRRRPYGIGRRPKIGEARYRRCRHQIVLLSSLIGIRRSIDGRDAIEPSQGRDFRRGWTQMHADIPVVDRISGPAIDCSFRVMNRLSACSARTIYENTLAHEMDEAGRRIVQRQAIAVRCDDIAAARMRPTCRLATVSRLNSRPFADPTKRKWRNASMNRRRPGLHVCPLRDFGNAGLKVQRIARDLSARTRHRRTSACIRG